MAARARDALSEARDEYRRLLYVAMTRAAERLIVCGARGKNKIPDGCWYQLVDDALRRDSVREPADDGGGEVLRYRKGRQPSRQNFRRTSCRRRSSLDCCAAWLTT